MNKMIKAVLWTIFVCMAICIIGICFMNIDFEAEYHDILLYKCSSILLLGIIEIGLLLELDPFHIKQKMPLLIGKTVLSHVVLWFIIFIISIVVFAIPFGMISDEFKEKIKTENTTSVYATENQSKKDDVDSEENIDVSKDKKFIKGDTKTTEEEKFNKGDTKTTEVVRTTEITTKKAELSWKTLSIDRVRYKIVMMTVGENFHVGYYTDSIDAALISDSEKSLVKDLFAYYKNNNSLPDDFTATFTDFCKDKEFDNMILELEKNSFYNAMSNSFCISWSTDGSYYIDIKEQDTEIDRSNDIVKDDDPLVFSLTNGNYSVGNCFFSINEIKMACEPFKGKNYTNEIRIYGSVKNNSSETTIFSTCKNGSNFVGKYHSVDGDIMIGGNSFIKWANDTKKDQFAVNYTLAPGEKREFQVQAIYTGNPITYGYKINMDLYFSNDDELLTVTLS